MILNPKYINLDVSYSPRTVMFGKQALSLSLILTSTSPPIPISLYYRSPVQLPSLQPKPNSLSKFILTCNGRGGCE